MIDGRSVLAVIAARGGSKGLPGKNLSDLGGKPLVAWSVAAAHESRYLDRVILSSDDDAIIDAARRAGCEVPFRRPAQLATDTASSIDVLFHAAEALDEAYDILVLLQATSPLRRGSDIDAGLERMIAAQAPACVSVCRPSHPPLLFYRLDERGRMRPLIDRLPAGVRRQDMPESWLLNGAFYAAETDWLRRNGTFVTEETVALVMPPERSVDIDDKLDLALARAIVADGMIA